MTRAAGVLFWGYVIVLLVAGATGVLVPEWELSRIFGVQLDDMDQVLRATILTQYRFLASVEFGFGLFSVVCRWEIFCVHKYNRIFLIALFGGVVARTLALALDGVPHWIFPMFLVLELTTGVLVLIASKKTLGPA